MGSNGVAFPRELTTEISEAAPGWRLEIFHPAVTLQEKLVKIPHFAARGGGKRRKIDLVGFIWHITTSLDGKNTSTEEGV